MYVINLVNHSGKIIKSVASRVQPIGISGDLVNVAVGCIIVIDAPTCNLLQSATSRHLPKFT